MKNKILIINIVLLLIVFILTTNVFAYSEEFEYNNSTYEMYLPDGAYNTIIELDDYKSNNYDFFVLCGNSRVYVNFFPKEFNLKIWKADISGGTFYSNSDLIDGFYCNHYVLTESGEIVETVLNRTVFATTTESDGYYVNGSKHYFYTNLNIYTDSTCIDIFFQGSSDSSIEDSNTGTGTGESGNVSEDNNNDSWFSKIIDSIVNLPSNIINGLSSFFDGITQCLRFINPFDEDFILKGVLEFLSNILSYINPFSENFFAYKLVEILLEGLKGLFVPSDNYFSDYFDELNNWFSERLGFLYYPLELIFDILDRMLNINFKDPVINIPDIKEPTTNITLIKATSFNFNSLLDNSVFSNVHNIYLLIVDAGIYIGLVMLLMKKYEEVMTK